MDKNNKIQESQQSNKNIWKLKKWAIILSIMWVLWWIWWRKLNDKYQEYLNSKEVPVKVYDNLSQLYKEDIFVWKWWIDVNTTNTIDWQWAMSYISEKASAILPDKIAKSIWSIDDQVDTVKLKWFIEFGVKKMIDTTHIKYNYNNPDIDKIEITMPDPSILTSAIEFDKSDISAEENKMLWDSEKMKQQEKEYRESWWNWLRNKTISKIFTENKDKISKLCIDHIFHTINTFGAQTKHTNKLQIIIKDKEWNILATKNYEPNHKIPPKDNLKNYIKKQLKKYYTK